VTILHVCLFVLLLFAFILTVVATGPVITEISK